MKTRNQGRVVKFIVGAVALCAFAINAQSTVLIDELFESGYSRTVNNIGNSNMAWFKARYNDTATANVGSLSFSTSSNSGADAFWGYFTDPAGSIPSVGNNSSVSNGKLFLGVGDTLITSVSFYLTTMPTDTSSAQVRYGVFDTGPGRSMNDLNGGASSTMFSNNPGFATFISLMNNTTNNGISIYKHTVMTTTGLFGASSDYTQIDGSVGGLSTAQTSGEKLTWSFKLTRTSSADWNLESDLYDTLTSALLEGGSVTTNDAAAANTFSMIGLRFPRSPDGTMGPYVYTDLKVEVIPEPSTLMLAGTGLALAIVAIRRRRS